MNMHTTPQRTPAETALVDAFAERVSLLPGAIAASLPAIRAYLATPVAKTRNAKSLSQLNREFGDVIEVLETEGVQKFEDSYAQLADSVKSQLDAASS